MSKRFSAFLAAVILSVSLVACGSQNGTSKEPDESLPSSEAESSFSAPERSDPEPTEVSDVSTGEEEAILSGMYLLQKDGLPQYFNVRPCGDGYCAMFLRRFPDDSEFGSFEFRGGLMTGTCADDGKVVFDCPPDRFTVTVLSAAELEIDPGDGPDAEALGGTYLRVDAREQAPYEIPTLPAFAADPNCDTMLDITLAAAIRSELGLPAERRLTSELLESVTDLMIYDTPITSLTGISALQNLRRLCIGSGYVSDISELTALPSLESADLSWCLIRTIPDLSGCTALRELRLSANLIEDLSPLLTAPNLRTVCVDSNLIHSVAPLAGCRTIELLALDNNCILDYACLEGNADLIRAIDNGSNFRYQAALETERLAKRLAEELTSDLSSDLQKEIAIYRYIIDNTEFEAGSFSETAYGERALKTHKGVCGNYAEAFALLMNHAGIWADTVASTDHEWNIVRIDGSCYHCDVLWDENNDIWSYFNRETSFILFTENHFHDLLRYPVCPSEADPVSMEMAKEGLL